MKKKLNIKVSINETLTKNIYIFINTNKNE